MQMTVRLLLFRGFFISLWVGDFGNPDLGDSLGDLDGVLSKSCAGRSLLRRIIV